MFTSIKTLKKNKIVLFGVVSIIFGLTAAPNLVHGGVEQISFRQSSRSISGSSEMLQASLEAYLRKGKMLGVRLLNSNEMLSFYKDRDFKYVWLTEAGVNNNARVFKDALEYSWTHGFNPKAYHYDEIVTHWGAKSSNNKAELELLLTNAFIKHTKDMTAMRINPSLFKLRKEDWKKPISAQESLKLLVSNRNIRATLKEIEPQGKTYKKLRRELIRLVDEESHHYEAHLPIEFKGLMKPGWSHAQVEKLRYRLGVPASENRKYRYDDTLAAAVMRFQKDNGLDADGIIGANTLQVLNRTKDSKIKQIIANMERLRWVEPDRGDRYVMVNIPSYKLWAIDDGRVDFEMPVIVGSPWRRTRMFKTEITGVRFNPDWTIPPTIKRFDIWPKVKENPNYLNDKGIQLFEGYGRNAVSLDPHAIDWENLSLSELHSIRMVQIPGDHNPLGHTRVLMPNPFNMYLHDTNKRSYFEKTERALSSGCIRMEEPERMADFILDPEGWWNDKEKQEMYASDDVIDVMVTDSMPVYVVYYTNWIDDNGSVVYGSDVYGYDTKLIEALETLDGLFIPSHNEGSKALYKVSYQE